MAFFKKKKEDEEAPPIPDISMDELPPLPPLPGEEELSETPYTPEPAPRARRSGAPVIPEMSMGAPMPEPRPMPMAPPSDKATVFVRIDKYRDIMKTITDMESKVEELKATLDRISSIKGREAEIVDGWNAMLQDAKAKLDDVHSKLTKPEA
jgi:hypothetical protein